MSDLGTELQKLSPSAVIELFEIDLTPDEDIEENRYYFHAGTNKLNANITWDGQVYAAWPLEISGYTQQAGGSLPRVRLKLANVNGLLSMLALNFNDMLGAKLTRYRTFSRFLDAVNFVGGVNADADPTIQIGQPDIYYLERKVSENKLMVELEFASEFDVVGVMLPRRQINPFMCAWCYRGSECGWTGAPVADEFGQGPPVVPTDGAAPFDEFSVATSYVPGDCVYYLDERRIFVCILASTANLPTNPTYWWEDKCGGSVTDCKIRIRPEDIYPFGGFPGASRVPDL